MDPAGRQIIMRFAEVFLRLGCALVARMMLYAHFVWLAALRSVGCGPDGDELHRLLLLLVPATVGFALLLRVTRPLEGLRVAPYYGCQIVRPYNSFDDHEQRTEHLRRSLRPLTCAA